MKRIVKNIRYTVAVPVIFMLALLSSCDLEVINPSAVSLETAYNTPEGYKSLVNYCYDGLYYFYGKIDGIGIMEMGTDLWYSEDKEKGFAQYGSDMSTELGTLRVFWQGFYATVNYCNLAIYFADYVNGMDEDEINAKVAEAYFLRGWSNLNLVEQFGDVVLREKPITETGPDNFPERSSEAEFYDLIISDLKFAVLHLPISQGDERGRVSKKAAIGMLAKAYLQRTRLGEDKAQEYAGLALEAAEELINNKEEYGCKLYTSNDSVSGYAQLWDGENNKDNKEFLFIEAVDHETFLNPDGDNRGRTRQYYLMDLKTVGAEWGTTEKNCYWYSRANDRGFKPTKYLLTEVFEPVEDPADTRFEETFFTQYFNSTWADFIISEDLVTKYDKDPSIIGDTIVNTAGTYNTTDLYYGGRSYYGINASGCVNMVDEDNDGYLDGLSVFTPNYNIPTEEKALMPFLCVDPSDMFTDEGRWVNTLDQPHGTEYKDCYPSMKKFSSLYWIYTNQKWEGDVPILRMGEIYLIAAEAALRADNNIPQATLYINEVRRRAAISSRAAEMDVMASEVNLDFVLEERARELAGEQVRWVDLKRFGKLNSSYLNEKNPDIVAFDDAKNTRRPIPQSFLDAIANPEEFGTNGY